MYKSYSLRYAAKRGMEPLVDGELLSLTHTSCTDTGEAAAFFAIASGPSKLTSIWMSIIVIGRSLDPGSSESPSSGSGAATRRSPGQGSGL